MRKKVEINILQKQRKIKVNEEFLKEKIGKLVKNIKSSIKKISVYLVNNKTIKDLNKKFLNRNSPTDVLTFKYSKNYGEIIISVEECKKNANFYFKKLEEEILYVLIHGILHLEGYKDYKENEREKMFEQQNIIFEIIMKNEK
ncbi:MAG: rRNA maturation RNase YbeY [Candidatus Omnitrophica bacterium]|nr:rRNA maturation RNase YbeY [Candidatus Omnitrophota bacterium]